MVCRSITCLSGINRLISPLVLSEVKSLANPSSPVSVIYILSFTVKQEELILLRNRYYNHISCTLVRQITRDPGCNGPSAWPGVMQGNAQGFLWDLKIYCMFYFDILILSIKIWVFLSGRPAVIFTDASTGSTSICLLYIQIHLYPYSAYLDIPLNPTHPSLIKRKRIVYSICRIMAFSDPSHTIRLPLGTIEFFVRYLCR